MGVVARYGGRQRRKNVQVLSQIHSLPIFVSHNNDHGACNMHGGRFCLHKRISKQKNSAREHRCVWMVAQYISLMLRRGSKKRATFVDCRTDCIKSLLSPEGMLSSYVRIPSSSSSSSRQTCLGDCRRRTRLFVQSQFLSFWRLLWGDFCLSNRIYLSFSFLGFVNCVLGCVLSNCSETTSGEHRRCNLEHVIG